jgi:trehalose 6-phosphate phosphatase
MNRIRSSRRRSPDSKSSKSLPKPHQSSTDLKPQYLFDCWTRVDTRIRKAWHIVIFLDLDGTLVRLRRNPKEVFLGAPARRVLRKLAGRSDITLCFISGRQLADLQHRARVEGAIYFGVHGWQRSNGQPPNLQGTRKLRKTMEWAMQQIRDIPGIRVEDKGICFGIHYRNAGKPAVRKAHALVQEVLARLGPGYKLLAGKKIWEIYPKDMGSKGLAAKDLLQQIPGRKLAVYAGDDTTDETAFALLRKGVTIRVGKFRETRANFFLRGPAEVLKFLKKLEESLT